jgi:predicted ATPase
VKQPLGEALNFWRYYLRTGRSPDSILTASGEIKVDTLEDVLVRFDIMSPDGKEVHALADSGFGYSQVLPIIARGLLMGLGGTLVVEQPEVHLNPALQIRISEFFISLVRVGKQVVIETHSEHIVNYLRVRAAEDISGEISEASMILYIDSAHGLPSVYRLCVAEDGSIPDWPSGFFGEAATLSARILRAQRLHRISRHSS